MSNQVWIKNDVNGDNLDYDYDIVENDGIIRKFNWRNSKI
jgi:hypothetical protein